MKFTDMYPLGSVVYLKGAAKKVMVVGFKVSDGNLGSEEFDYMGVLFPEGFISQESVVFNHDDVNDVVFRGYENPEQKEFMNYLDAYWDQMQSGEIPAEE